MENHIPTREEAFALLSEYTQSESLIRHALSVEAVMRHFAKIYGEDEEIWGIVGLIHDLDWEKYPDQHCQMTQKILEDHQWPMEYIRAVMSHGWGTCTNVEPLSLMEKVLYATDELTGLVATTALVRPSKSVLDVEPKSVKKKWNDKRFAAGVDRSIIERGAELLQLDLTDLIQGTIEGMQTVSTEIGLKGNL